MVDLHVRAVAERMATIADELTDDMVEAVLEAAPVLASDPILTARTRASTAANVRRWVALTAEKPDRPVIFDVPPEALDLARDVARRGMDRDGLLTAYRTGQNVAWARAMRCAREEGLDGEDLIAALDVLSRLLFDYVD